MDDAGNATEPSGGFDEPGVHRDSRDDTSTFAVPTSKLALLNASAAASAFSRAQISQHDTLPALTRRAIAWPIDPGPMTTMTSLITMLSRDVTFAY